MALTTLITIPTGINTGVRPARQATMLQLLGSPRHTYGRDCQPVMNPNLKVHIVTRSVGPFRVTGFDKAVHSLTEIMAEIKATKPDIHDALGSAGMLCARFVRGSEVSISNHSWGTAVDLTLDGNLDQRGDGFCQQGLAEIAPIFNTHGWFWGAGFRTEDAMHFEVADDTIHSWFTGVPAIAKILSIGDRGPEVLAIQKALNALGFTLIADGVFGRGTMAQIMAFQRAKGLAVDGVVGHQTSVALGLA
ncbi:MAG: spore cortex-lytic enzyme [Candidatus Accumulibacter appositus]|uniref:Spore cortex-lytic enzyme n=1 Tax=Candidatus Accumulibacter appositus TaxID=1454003 RepID=A0A011Q1M5_9PROT|nr:peptidoglycan-binding protein [Accumulibacter sp.]EXI83055.1 MAG: spore cortex-lytic enzyme [Candidatus Accumulibacter appositus]HRF04049.1 peptidoglycan-binding protein [Accumulibacter sp.]